MPAPTPIQIRYGTGGLLPLAAAAGSSVGGVVSARRAEDDRRFHQQLVLANMARNRAPATVSPFALQQAAAYGPRYAAQRGGNVTSVSGRARTPLQIARDQAALEGQLLRNEKLRRSVSGSGLVPAEGPMAPEGGGIVMEGRGVFPRNRQEDMVTPEVRAQLDYLRQIRGQIPEENWQGLYIAAKAGTLTMDQLIDNARQFLPQSSARMTAIERSVDRLQAEARELMQILQMDEKDQAFYARRRFNMQDPDIHSDQDAIEALRSRSRQVAAILKPIQNSNGATPTGGNIVQVQTPEQARQLPSGTYFQTPDGRVKRVP